MISHKGHNVKPFFLILNIWLGFVSRAEAAALTRLSLQDQIERADVIALVRLKEAKYADGPRIVKLLVVEVSEAIFNSRNGDKLNLLGRNGVVGSDLEFDCLGSEAIIIMEKADPKYAPENYYKSVNDMLSVYHLENNKWVTSSSQSFAQFERGKVIGIKDKPIEIDEAIELIRAALKTKEKNES
jgi:hypothetical protein